MRYILQFFLDKDKSQATENMNSAYDPDRPALKGQLSKI